jgi:hypothetical protein
VRTVAITRGFGRRGRATARAFCAARAGLALFAPVLGSTPGASALSPISYMGCSCSQPRFRSCHTGTGGDDAPLPDGLRSRARRGPAALGGPRSGVPSTGPVSFVVGRLCPKRTA